MESAGWQVSLPIYIDNMLKSLKSRYKQAEPGRLQPCADGSPQRLSLVRYPKQYRKFMRAMLEIENEFDTTGPCTGPFIIETYGDSNSGRAGCPCTNELC